MGRADTLGPEEEMNQPYSPSHWEEQRQSPRGRYPTEGGLWLGTSLLDRGGLDVKLTQLSVFTWPYIFVKIAEVRYFNHNHLRLLSLAI